MREKLWCIHINRHTRTHVSTHNHAQRTYVAKLISPPASLPELWCMSDRCMRLPGWLSVTYVYIYINTIHTYLHICIHTYTHTHKHSTYKYMCICSKGLFTKHCVHASFSAIHEVTTKTTCVSKRNNWSVSDENFYYVYDYQKRVCIIHDVLTQLAKVLNAQSRVSVPSRRLHKSEINPFMPRVQKIEI